MRKFSRIHLAIDWNSQSNHSSFSLNPGDVNFPAVMSALREIGYDGPVTSEFFNCEADLPKISAAMDEILK